MLRDGLKPELRAVVAAQHQEMGLAQRRRGEGAAATGCGRSAMRRQPVAGGRSVGILQITRRDGFRRRRLERDAAHQEERAVLRRGDGQDPSASRAQGGTFFPHRLRPRQIERRTTC